MGIEPHRCECSACVELHTKVHAVVKDLREAAAIRQGMGDDKAAAMLLRIVSSLEK